MTGPLSNETQALLGAGGFIETEEALFVAIAQFLFRFPIDQPPGQESSYTEEDSAPNRYGLLTICTPSARRSRRSRRPCANTSEGSGEITDKNVKSSISAQKIREIVEIFIN